SRAKVRPYHFVRFSTSMILSTVNPPETRQVRAFLEPRDLREEAGIVKGALRLNKRLRSARGQVKFTLLRSFGRLNTVLPEGVFDAGECFVARIVPNRPPLIREQGDNHGASDSSSFS
ncbi:MAG TPA: hypothetical protein VMY69_00640, partial [Phycisphaerae bacterium]|nr:hypothetical protein [Phycisphaerae bacterium]